MSAFMPTLKQLQYLVALKEHGHFGARGRCDFRDAIDALGRHSRAGVADRRHACRAHAADCALHGAGGPHRREGAPGASRSRGIVGHRPGLGHAAGWRAAHERHPHDRTVPAAQPAAPAARRAPASSSTCARRPATPRWIRCAMAMPTACCWRCLSRSATLRRKCFSPIRSMSPSPRTIRAIRPHRSTPDKIDGNRLLLLEDGHCLKDHALAACNRAELRTEATITGTSLHTLVQMVDNGLGLTLLPEMAIRGGILVNTQIAARPIRSAKAHRDIALIWRRNSPREADFRMLAASCAMQRATARRKGGLTPGSNSPPSSVPRPAMEMGKEAVGLVHADNSAPGITRRKLRGHWAYFDPAGERIADRDAIDRLNSIGLPPAYGEAWFAPDPNAHLQATGVDARGRKQYRYHPRVHGRPRRRPNSATAPVSGRCCPGSARWSKRTCALARSRGGAPSHRSCACSTPAVSASATRPMPATIAASARPRCAAAMPGSTTAG